MYSRRWFFIALVAACSGGDAAPVDGPTDTSTAPIDGDDCIDCDRDLPACTGLGLGLRPITALRLLDATGTAGRTLRAQITLAVDRCDRPAIPSVAIDLATHTVTIRGSTFVAAMPCGAAPPLVRTVGFTLEAGTWTVAAAGTALAERLVVGPAPARPCLGGAGTGPCALDCDCAAGEQCLGGTGLAGPFTACARSCELDRDCGGVGRCVSADDGLDLTCDQRPECDATQACPDGYACAAGACTPSFTLSSTTRHACSCDADCGAPLRCIADDGGGGARCELPCPTTGGWCQGAHVCGPATADLSGLAHVDSVCGFLGD